MSIRQKLGNIANAQPNRVTGVVIDVLLDRVSVRLSGGSGQKLSNLQYTGATPTIGDTVDVFWNGGIPRIQTRSDNPNTVTAQAVTVIRNETISMAPSGGGQQETVTPDARPVLQAIFTMEGTLATGEKPIRIYNKYGSTKTISEVFLAVQTAPTDAEIIVDINIDGSTIFATQANRPQITSGSNTGTSATMDTSEWNDGEYLTFDIDQVGSSIPGSNLTVQVIFS